MNNSFTIEALLKALLYHHTQVRHQGTKGDQLGMDIYQTLLEEVRKTGKMTSSGKVSYLLERIHPKGRWSNYYQTLYTPSASRRMKSEIIEFYKAQPHLIILSTEAYGHYIKDETKANLCGSIEVFDDWCQEVVFQEQRRLFTLLLNNINAGCGLFELPKQDRLVILKGISWFLLLLGECPDAFTMKHLFTLMKEHSITDKKSVFA